MLESIARSPFGAGYADHYDLFYAEKDYTAECDILEAIFARYAREPIHTILDLGCGTGSHVLSLAARGYPVWGVDRSPGMLAVAQSKAAADPCRPGKAHFVAGDVRTIDLGLRFDAVLMMFAVLGYQVRNADVAAALATVRRHLRPGGLFVADFWYGPAVLREGPSDRIHEYQAGDVRILRLAQSRLHAAEQKVDIHYRVLQIRDQAIASETDETHAVRFFFPLELAYYAAAAGLDLVDLRPLLQLDGSVDDNTWNVTAIMRAI